MKDVAGGVCRALEQRVVLSVGARATQRGADRVRREHLWGKGAVVSTCMQGSDAAGRGSSPSRAPHSVVISGHQRSSVVISGHQQGSDPYGGDAKTTGHERREGGLAGARGATKEKDDAPAVISGHQRSSVVISGHRRSSVVISGNA